MTALISYAQNFEDVMLWRALGHVKDGFYIDIGAQDPVVDSVSLAFHEHGWQGIHVEPTPHYAELLRQQRPGDTVIQAAVGNGPAVLRFFEITDTGISTADPVMAEQHRERGFDVHEITVACIALSAVFKTCAGSEIHWLKIDVEGFEKQVLSSWGKSTARPWIVIVESTLPLTQIETHESWEAILIGYGYSPVYFDGLNRYYISNVHPELKNAFLAPPNVFDGFTLNGTASAPFHHLIEARYKQKISETLAQNEQQKLSANNEIERLTLSLAALDKTHAEHEQNWVQREQEIAAQLLAIQQQAEWEKAEQARSHSEQERALYREHAEREQALSQQLQAAQQELHSLEQERTQREKEHGEQTSQIRQELENFLRTQVQREQEIAAQLLAIQQQADAEKTELSQQHQAHLQDIQRQQAEHEWLTAERIHTLNQELHRLQTDNATREHAHADMVNSLQKELTTLLRVQAQREQEIAAQLLAIQQQANQEKAEQARSHSEQAHALQRGHAEREQALSQQLQAAEQELRRLEQDRAQREKEHAEQTSQIRQALESLLRAQAQREQEVAAQLLAIQQQAAHEKAEQAHNHSEQAHALQREHAEREQALSQQLQAGQQELRHLEQAWTDMQHQLDAQLQAERKTSQQLQQMLNTLQCELAIMRNGLSWRLTAPLRAVAGWFKPIPTQTEPINSRTEHPPVAPFPHPESDTTPHGPLSEITSMTSDYSIQATQPTLSSTTPNLNTLLQHQDRQFVECAYLTLLKRQPDPEGFNYYLGRLRAGVPKIQILGQLLDSGEARASDVDIPGLRDAVQRQKLARLPLIGTVLKYFIKVEGNSAFENRLRTIEQQIFRLEKQSDARFERIDHGLNNLQKLIIQQTQQIDLIVNASAQTSQNIVPDISLRSVLTDQVTRWNN